MAPIVFVFIAARTLSKPFWAGNTRKYPFNWKMSCQRKWRIPKWPWMALRTKDWERVNACLMRLYRELDAKRFPRLMLQLLNELVPGDSVVLNFIGGKA